MRQSLRSHILYLENTLRNLRESLTRPDLTPEEIEDIELQSALAESALEHYREAYKLELSVSGSEPPNQPSGAQPESGADITKSSGFRKKKDGLAVAQSRKARKRAPRSARTPVGCCVIAVPQEDASWDASWGKVRMGRSEFVRLA